ncbi:MAG TPA: N-6 DNA methylase [Sphingomicrobium sp.]|nr:N-6 DNA methylase [Sphingomicrobium sp.]
MWGLWEDLYRASEGDLGRQDARRVANLAIALHMSETRRNSDQSAFFEDLARVAGTLGGALPLPAALAFMIWTRLKTEPVGNPTYEQIDEWIEAFQAADGSRKSLGAYATPSAFSHVLARETLKPLLNMPQTHRIVDPAAGAGSLLLAAHRCMVDAGHDPVATVYNLLGVELDPAARELCVLLLWLSAGPQRTKLDRVAANIRVANAVTFDWSALGPFDALLMNPPWESLRQRRDEPEHEEVREATLRRIHQPAPGADGLPPLYTMQGRGDRNLFKMFAELAPHLLREGGRFGAVLPAAFGSDDGMSALRAMYLTHLALERWTSFENRGRYFQIDSRFKFGLLTGSRAANGTTELGVLSFCTHPEAVEALHVTLDRDELAVIGGKDHMIPELTSRTERDVLNEMIAAGTPLFEHGPLGTVKYRREVDLTMGRRAGRFWHVNEVAIVKSWATEQLSFDQGSDVVPVLEGRMIAQYDCFQKSWVSGHGRTAVWTENGEQPLNKCLPQYMTTARQGPGARVAICDVTSATNTRTVLAALVPPTWVCGNTAPVLVFETQTQALAGLAILNSMVFDWFARRIVGGLHLNKFYLARLTWPRLTADEIVRLAELAGSIAAHFPRGLVPFRPSRDSRSLVRMLAEVEVLIAQAYGLDSPRLEQMFTPDRRDRRGLWRYFSARPISREVAVLAIADVTQSPDPKTTLAA